MKKYTYIVMCSDLDIEYWDVYNGGSIEAVAAFSSEEEANAVATLKNASYKRHQDDYDHPTTYYVVRVPMYS